MRVPSESEDAGLRWSLSGLHAKLYVVERNKEAHVFIGSANTTNAAWGGNDELLLEIVGKVGVFGVEVKKSDNPPAADVVSTPELARRFNPTEPPNSKGPVVPRQ